jgi:putative PIN family toxin of toxin-antitoxin system
MKNIVLDTNCLLASLSRNQEEYIIWSSLQEGRFNLCVTNEILDEYVEVLQRNISPTIAENVMFLLLNLDNLIFVDTYFKFNLITADPDDNKFVDCAIAANAEYIVTNDKHFKELEIVDFPRVKHIPIDEFVTRLKRLRMK